MRKPQAGAAVPLRSVPAGTFVTTSITGKVVNGTETTGGMIALLVGAEYVWVRSSAEVVIVDEELPSAVMSMISASVDGGPAETLVLAETGRWYRLGPKQFVKPDESISQVTVLYRAQVAPVDVPVKAPTEKGDRR